ncbi:MAG TPA: ESX secretion-associated protein EspG [Amycolatopsis sp.]|nr:ESX secretion-associated protein EspG [Amycolatopsis sp.]
MQPLTLPELAFVVLWEKLGLGDLPRPLFIPSPGATAGERANLERAAALELVHQGFGYGGSADEKVERALGVLAGPSTEYYGWIVPPNGDTIGFVAATDGRDAVLAQLVDGSVRLLPIPPQGLAAALCRELPLEAGGPGPPVSLPRHAPQLADLIAPPLGIRAQFFVSVLDRTGARHRSEHPVDYAQTQRGNWIFHTLSGRDLITIVPANAAVLTTALDQTCLRLRPARAERTTAWSRSNNS